MSTHRDDTATVAGRLRLALDKHDTGRFNLPINIGIAVAFLGLGMVARILLPWPATKFLAGVAVVALIVCALATYLRHQSRKADAVETEADTTS